MKRILMSVIAGLVLTGGVGAAPAAKKPSTDDQTKIEKTINRRGSLYAKDIYEAGSVPSKYSETLNISLIIISDPDHPSAPKDYGIKFAFTKDDSTNSGYLDYDEAQDLSSALAAQQTIASKMTGEDHENTEVHYKTRDDMDFGFFQTARDQTAFVEIEGENCFITMENYRALKVAVDQAIGRLKDKGATSVATVAQK